MAGFQKWTVTEVCISNTTAVAVMYSVSVVDEAHNLILFVASPTST